ncbi:hypothetical protein FQZ97_1099600 [compost metagenome]
MPSDLPRISHVSQTVPLRPGAGKLKWFAGFLAQRSKGRQRHAEVHGIADGVANHGVRSVDAPGEAIPLSCGEEFIFLGVVKVLDVQAR